MTTKQEENIVQCANCGIRNRLNPDNEKMRPICGKCGASLYIAKEINSKQPIIKTKKGRYDNILTSIFYSFLIVIVSLMASYYLLNDSKKNIYNTMHVIPTEAGIQFCSKTLRGWMPASAGLVKTALNNNISLALFDQIRDLSNTAKIHLNKEIILYTGYIKTPNHITVMTNYGTRQLIYMSHNTVIFAMATWCNSSAKLNRILNDPSVRYALKKMRIIYLYNNEWDGYRNILSKAGLNADEIITQRKSINPNSVVVYPDELQNAAGEVFFATPDIASKITFFPAVYHRNCSSGMFKDSAGKWLYSNIPYEILKSILEENQ